MTRRGFLLGTTALAVAGCAVRRRAFCGAGWKIALNPSTLRGYKLDFRQQVEVAVAAGYDGIEPWIRDLRAAQADGSLGDAVRFAKDRGLSFVNGIAFGEWANPDPVRRAAGLEETKRDMALLAEIGCPMIAASMFGIQKPGTPIEPLPALTERYAAVLELGRAAGVRPLLEYWGHSVNLCKVADALQVAAATGDAQAGVLADVYHTYRGGNSFETFRFLSPAVLPVLHVNDYPATPAADELKDADRVYPGDGIAPWARIFRILSETGARPWLSLELFNPNYWNSTPLQTARTGLAKTRTVCSRFTEEA